MKAFKTITFLLISTLLLSCGSDDGPDNRAPEKAVLTSPANNTGDVALEGTTLTWQQVGDPDGDPVSYDIYFDTINPPAAIAASNLNTTNYAIGETLQHDTSYYWMVVAKDGNGGQSQSNVAFFTTREATSEELLIGKKWFMNEEINNGTPQPLTDCNKKTYFMFSAEGFLTIESFGGDPCMSSTTVYPYEMISESVIHVDNGSPGGLNWTISSITETELEILYGTQQVNFIRKD